MPDTAPVFVVVLEADYSGTYFPTLGGVHGPYGSQAEAEAAVAAAGYVRKPDTTTKEGRVLEGEWVKTDRGWSGEWARIIELTALGEGDG